MSCSLRRLQDMVEFLVPPLFEVLQLDRKTGSLFYFYFKREGSLQKIDGRDVFRSLGVFSFPCLQAEVGCSP